MRKIGLISDTHGFLDPGILNWFKGVDEVWHAGDIGGISLLETLENFKPVRAVYGNIDGRDIRDRLPDDQIFRCEDIRVWITHIGGYPGKYDGRVRKRLKEIRPGLLVCGHSHILKVMYDHSHRVMYMNPGAAGKAGTHVCRTALRFNVVKDKIEDLEVLELPR